jgi:small subunit ribosomal protein S6
MRNYEVGLIIHPDTGVEAQTELVEKVKGWIAEAGGSVTKVDLWGKRRMAYRIRKQHDGIYAFLFADMPAPATGVLEHNLRLTESVMRFSIIRPEA